MSQVAGHMHSGTTFPLCVYGHLCFCLAFSHADNIICLSGRRPCLDGYVCTSQRIPDTACTIDIINAVQMTLLLGVISVGSRIYLRDAWTNGLVGIWLSLPAVERRILLVEP